MLNLWQIKFPVYKFSVPNFTREGDLSFVESSTGELKLVDDKSMPGDSIGIRRLMHQATYGADAYKLYNLNKPLFTIAEMIQNPSNEYIDSTGKIFKYTKKEFFHVHTYKLYKYVEFQEGYVLYPKGLHCRFFLSRAPELHEQYVQVLHMGMGFMLYGLSSEDMSVFRRKV